MPNPNRNNVPPLSEAVRSLREDYENDDFSARQDTYIAVLLPALEAMVRRGTETTALVNDVPQTLDPGLHYVGASGFQAMPAEGGWGEHAKSGTLLSILDLRVMAAHLTTALDNVTAALKAKGL